MYFHYGIEHEVAFLNAQGKLADHLNTSFDDFSSIIEQLPLYNTDYDMLRIGDARIKVKRWYIEGFERFNDSGQVIACSPKGIEIRTTIHDSITDTIKELSQSFTLLKSKAINTGYIPALISHHPWHQSFSPYPPLSEYEINRRHKSPEKLTADIPMMTQGPDLSLSCTNFSTDDVIHAAMKLTAYSPYIIPFSFSSPFYAGTTWRGLSVRTFYRTGARPAAMAFIDDDSKMLSCSPSLTQKARIPSEVGRIEFKAFDSCADFKLYAALLSLLKGIILDKQLPMKSSVPNTNMHQHSALYGFHDEHIKTQAREVLIAAQCALKEPSDKEHLSLLFDRLESEIMPADSMKKEFDCGESIENIMKNQYEYNDVV